MKSRECVDCERRLPLTTDYFYLEHSHNGKYYFRHTCKECLKKVAKEYKQRHASAIVAKRKTAEARALGRKYARQYREVPKNRISLNISRGIRRSIGGQKGGRHWEEVLGYSIHDLMVHLEAQFARGMTWANYGEWHIDHIRSVRDFNITSLDDPALLECWSLWNLRPLWARDNHSKGYTNLEPPLPLTTGGDAFVQ